MKYLAILAIFVLACCTPETPVQPSTTTDEVSLLRGSHPCLDAFLAALDTVEGCAELKLIYPNISCFGCDFAAEGSRKEATSAWKLRCEAMQCEWCDKTPPSCD